MVAQLRVAGVVATTRPPTAVRIGGLVATVTPPSAARIRIAGVVASTGSNAKIRIAGLKATSLVLGPAMRIAYVDAASITGTFVYFTTPISNAGPDQTVYSLSTVLLDGSASTGQAAITTYTWTQVAGPTVTLLNPTTARPSFISPARLADTVLTFSLVVTDSAGTSSAADLVNITVHQHPLWVIGPGSPLPVESSPHILEARVI